MTPEERKERDRVYHRDYSRRWYTTEKGRRYKWKNRFGLTEEDYSRMEANQNGVCAVCSRMNLDGRKLFVDHDHLTGRIRGLLCMICNRQVAHYEAGLAVQFDQYLKDTLEPPY